jgi:hypothetical protein
MVDETKKPRPRCAVCGKPIEHGTPRYQLFHDGGLASVHVECHDTVKPDLPRA